MIMLQEGYLSSKVCTKCKTAKQSSEYYRNPKGKDGLATECKDCFKSRQKKLYDANPGLKRKYSTKYKLKANYGLTPEDRLSMLEAVGFKCEICDKSVRLPDPGCGNDNANIDHDHKTGKVRGILCGHCNKGLGHFMDDTHLMSRAIAYLTERNT